MDVTHSDLRYGRRASGARDILSHDGSECRCWMRVFGSYLVTVYYETRGSRHKIGHDLGTAIQLNILSASGVKRYRAHKRRSVKY